MMLDPQNDPQATSSSNTEPAPTPPGQAPPVAASSSPPSDSHGKPATQSSSHEPQAFSIDVGGETRRLTQDELLQAAKVGLETRDQLKSLQPLIDLHDRITADPQARDRLAVALRAAGAGEDIIKHFVPSDVSSNHPPPSQIPAGDADVVKRLEALETLVKTQAEERAIADLKARFGDDAVNPQLLREKARELGIDDLTAVFKIITYDSVQERAVQEYIAGKRQPSHASPLPGGAPAPARSSADPPKTFREARELATQRLREVNAN